MPKYQAGKVIGQFFSKVKPSKEAIDALTKFIKDACSAVGYEIPKATSSIKNVAIKTAHSGYSGEAVQRTTLSKFQEPEKVINSISYTKPSTNKLRPYTTDTSDKITQTEAVVKQASSKLPYTKPTLMEPTYSLAKAMELEIKKTAEKTAKKLRRKVARKRAKELAQRAKEEEPVVIEEIPLEKSIGQKVKKLVQRAKGTDSKTASKTKEEATKKVNFFKKHPYATVATALLLSNGTTRKGVGDFLNWWTSSPSKQDLPTVPGPVKDTTTVDTTILNAVDAVNLKQQSIQKDSSFRSNEDYNDLFDDEQWLQ